MNILAFVYVMAGWKRAVASVGERRVVAGFGGLFVAVAAVRAFVLLRAGESLSGVLATDAVIAFPGIGLLYGAYRLRGMDLRPDVFSRVVARCLAGIGVMLGVVGLLAVSGINRPLFTPFAAPALGAIGGFGIGLNEARALSRARDAEQAQQELERTVERLRASNERLEQFTYAASHDLQEPLRMVSSYLQLLEDRYREEIDEDAREFIDYAIDGADRMRAMIESLLDYAQVNSQGQHPEPTDADRVFENARTDLRPRIEEADATVTVDKLPTVTVDPDQLAQVFRNLLSNALIYSGDEPPEIHVSANQVDDGWRLAIADDGIGIASEHHERIFKSFERLHTHDTAAGTGIELALCERIVERHGGDIWVESEPEGGSTFYVTLPPADEDVEPDGPTEREPVA